MGGGLKNKPVPVSSERLLTNLIKQVERFPHTAWSGYSHRTISRYGSYQEPGLELDQSDLVLGQHYAALSVLSRDMQAFLDRHPRTDARLFSAIVEQVSSDESSHYGNRAFPEYQGHPVQILPTGMAAKAAAGAPDLSPLARREIVHEWTSKPGRKLFDELNRRLRRRPKLRAVICGKGGVYRALNTGVWGKSGAVSTLSQVMLTAFGINAFWAPLAVLFSSVLVHKGLDLYCDPRGRSKR